MSWGPWLVQAYALNTYIIFAHGRLCSSTSPRIVIVTTTQSYMLEAEEQLWAKELSAVTAEVLIDTALTFQPLANIFSPTLLCLFGTLCQVFFTLYLNLRAPHCLY